MAVDWGLTIILFQDYHFMDGATPNYPSLFLGIPRVGHWVPEAQFLAMRLAR